MSNKWNLTEDFPGHNTLTNAYDVDFDEEYGEGAGKFQVRNTIFLKPNSDPEHKGKHFSVEGHSWMKRVGQPGAVLSSRQFSTNNPKRALAATEAMMNRISRVGHPNTLEGNPYAMLTGSGRGTRTVIRDIPADYESPIRADND